MFSNKVTTFPSVFPTFNLSFMIVKCDGLKLKQAGEVDASFLYLNVGDYTASVGCEVYAVYLNTLTCIMCLPSVYDKIFVWDVLKCIKRLATPDSA